MSSAPLYYGKWYEPQGVWAKLLDEDMEEIREMITEVVHKEFTLMQKEEQQQREKKAYPVLQEDGVCTLCPTCGKLDHYRFPRTPSGVSSEMEKMVYSLHKHLDWCRCKEKKQ